MKSRSTWSNPEFKSKKHDARSSQLSPTEQLGQVIDLIHPIASHGLDRILDSRKAKKVLLRRGLRLMYAAKNKEGAIFETNGEDGSTNFSMNIPGFGNGPNGECKYFSIRVTSSNNEATFVEIAHVYIQNGHRVVSEGVCVDIRDPYIHDSSGDNTPVPLDEVQNWLYFAFDRVQWRHEAGYEPRFVEGWASRNTNTHGYDNAYPGSEEIIQGGSAYEDTSPDPGRAATEK